MKLNELSNWLKIPGAIVAAAVGIGAILLFFGVEIHGPRDHVLDTEAKVEEVKRISEETRQWAEQQFESHVSAEQIYHDSLVYPYIQEVDDEVHNVLNALEAVLRGECLESTFDKLARQGLLEKCEALGIERRLGDDIDRELRENNNE